MTTSAQIKTWFNKGKADGATHMLVVCDTFDHEDYPVYVRPGQNPSDVTSRTCFSGNMQRLMECYALHKPWGTSNTNDIGRSMDFDAAPGQEPDLDVVKALLLNKWKAFNFEYNGLHFKEKEAMSCEEFEKLAAWVRS